MEGSIMQILRDGVLVEVGDDYLQTPPVDPIIVSARQMRLALHQMGMLAAVQAFVDAGDEAVHISWEYATEFTTAHPLVIAAKQALGKTDQEIESLFRLAATL